MGLQVLVEAFNNLPRSPKSQSGLVNNHWQFAVRHVPLNPPGDLVHFVNPESHFNHNEGPAQILSCQSVAEQADIMLPLLLKAYVNAMGAKLHDPHARPFAPWTWGTDNEELAKALEDRLITAGVRKELCSIKVGNEQSIQIEQEEWTNFYTKLQGVAGPRCTKCKSGPADDSQKLQLCGGCRKVHYCSKECQKADWKEHKIVCKSLVNSTTGLNHSGRSRLSSVSALEYYETIAPNSAKAKELAAEIGLRLPGSGSRQQGLSAPIRRLVVTGKDSPENLAILLGQNEKDVIDRIHKDTRMEVLLQPPKGSPAYAVAAMSRLDENCPPWTPREASATELEEVKKIRGMQGIIKSHMGSRDMSSINSRDMQEILVRNFGAAWDEALPRYQSAVNAMDQGVHLS